MAVAFLAAKGWRLMARRYGGKGGEIDLIMRRKRVVAFIEVKARGRMETALESVTPAKIAFIRRRIAQWRAENPWSQGYALRGDAIYLAPGRWPVHVEGAFELPEL